MTKFKNNMTGKIRESGECREMILLLKAREGEAEVKHNIFDNVFQAVVVPTGSRSVILYLGANVYVEYDYEEALGILDKNMKQAVINEQDFAKDIEYISE